MRNYGVRVIGVLVMLGFLVGIMTLLPANAQTGGNNRELTVGQPITGTLDQNNFAQSYIFRASAGNTATLTATTTSEGLSLAMILVAPSGVTVASDGDLTTPDTATISDVALAESGTYVVTVLRGTGSEGDTSGAFSLELSGTITAPVEAVATPATPPLTTSGDTVFVGLDRGGVDITLQWNAAVDLNLEVRDPVGGAVFYANPTVASGGTYSGNANENCTAASADNPTERVSWPTGTVPTGSYEILIHSVNPCALTGPQLFTLTASVNGDNPQVITGVLSPGQDHLARITLDTNRNWLLFNGGVNAGLDILTDGESLTLVKNAPIAGRLTNLNPKDIYVFDAAAGETFSIELNATSGSLDPLLILLGPNSERLADNDDRAADSRNSLLQYTVTQPGTYTLIATRYGQASGGTEGNYSLTVASGTTTVATTTDGGTTTTTTTTSFVDGSIEVKLTWNSEADLQLLVRDPSGVSVFDDRDRIPSGGILDQNFVGNRTCAENPPVEPTYYIYWPANRQPLQGVYEVEVWYQRDCIDAPLPVTFNLTVNVGNEEIINTSQSPTTVGNKYMITFTVDGTGKGITGTGGFFNMEDVTSALEFTAQLANAQIINYGDQIGGNITLEERFQIYRFEARAGDVVDIVMRRVGNNVSLDPAIYLVEFQGAVIQLTYNDDITPGTEIDSRIAGYRIDRPGTYYIVATHYGLGYGATVGPYTLRLDLRPTSP